MILIGKFKFKGDKNERFSIENEFDVSSLLRQTFDYKNQVIDLEFEIER